MRSKLFMLGLKEGSNDPSDNQDQCSRKIAVVMKSTEDHTRHKDRVDAGEGGEDELLQTFPHLRPPP